MKLERERLAELIVEIEDGLLERIKDNIKMIRDELEFLDTEEAHQSMIGEVSLKSPDPAGGVSGGVSDLAALEESIRKYTIWQKNVLNKTLQMEKSRQLVAFHVYHEMLKLRARDKKILVISSGHSLQQALNELEKMGILFSKGTLFRTKNALLDQMLERLNPELVLIDSYEKDEKNITGSKSAVGSAMVGEEQRPDTV